MIHQQVRRHQTFWGFVPARFWRSLPDPKPFLEFDNRQYTCDTSPTRKGEPVSVSVADSPGLPARSSSRLRRSRRQRVFAALAVGAYGTLAAFAPGAEAQTTSTLPPTTTIASPLTIAINLEAPLGNGALQSPSSMRTTVLVSNSGSTAATNLQMVLRFGARPDQVLSVTDGTNAVGLVDPVTGAWYHTIAAIPAGGAVLYSVNWVKYCAGRWPLAARVSDRTASLIGTWIGPVDSRCPADETASPQPAAFYQLPWPPATVPPVTTTVVAAPGGTTTVPPTSTTTLVSTTGTIAASVTTVAKSPTTLLSLPGVTTTTTTIPVSTTKAAPRTTTTKPGTVIFCKTVGGRRYCAPKSSAYKEGQAKSIELKPGQKAPATTKKKR